MSTALIHLRKVLNSYNELSESSWQAYASCCQVKTLKKGDILYSFGEKLLSFSFIHRGLMRAYFIDEGGNEYNKTFFTEGRFPGSMSALLKSEPNGMEIQAMEDCEIVEINHAQYRQTMFEHADLMKYQIAYLERHWLLEKEPKEMGYLQHEAKERYLSFVEQFEDVLPRIAQYHIASFLGITPTQLSRIKKELKEN
mgnify:CR=1 FL=1